MKTPSKNQGTNSYPDSLQEMRKLHIERTLRLVDQDVKKAAVLLEITVKELERLMRQLGVATPPGFSK